MSEPRSLNIVVLTFQFPATSETFVVDHIVGLLRYGHKVTVVAMSGDMAAKQEIEAQHGIQFDLMILDSYRQPNRIVRWFRLLGVTRFGRIRAVFSAWERDLIFKGMLVAGRVGGMAPDMVHAHFGPNGIAGSIVAEKLAIPLIADFHGFDVTVIPKTHGWEAYQRWLADCYAVVHSTFVEELVGSNLPCRVQKVRLGVDTSIFSAPDRASQWPETIRFLFVGRLVYQKGVHVALGMLALFKRHFPGRGMHLTICGDGPLCGFLQRLAKELKVEEHVTFAGATPYAEVAESMKAADILLIPSVPIANDWQEAFCRVAIEGMSMGLGVIGSETGGLQETIGSGGSTCRPGSAKDLFAVVESLLVSSSPKEEAGRAIERAREFTIEVMHEDYASVCDRAKTV